MSFPGSPFCEIIASDPTGEKVMPCFGDLFLDEPLPADGKLEMDNRPGFGMTLNPAAKLIPAAQYSQAPPDFAANIGKKPSAHMPNGVNGSNGV